MPPPEFSDRNQDAVLWAAGGTDGYGQPIVGVPVELRVRWVTKRSESTDKDGNVIALDATVVVDRRIAPGSEMWLGTLDAWYGTGSAGNDSEVMRVVTYNEVPDIKARFVRRTVGLKKFRDTVST